MEAKRVLFVVSNPVDVIITQMVFRDSKTKNELFIVSSGEQALHFLRRESPFEKEQVPDLIIVDLDINSTDGWDFLKEVKEDPEFKRIPVIVFILHMLDEDVSRLYDLNVNCCIQKPVDLEEFTKVVERIEQFWLSTVNYQHRPARFLRKT